MKRFIYWLCALAVAAFCHATGTRIDVMILAVVIYIAMLKGNEPDA